MKTIEDIKTEKIKLQNIIEQAIIDFKNANCEYNIDVEVKINDDIINGIYKVEVVANINI